MDPRRSFVVFILNLRLWAILCYMYCRAHAVCRTSSSFGNLLRLFPSSVITRTERTPEVAFSGKVLSFRVFAVKHHQPYRAKQNKNGTPGYVCSSSIRHRVPARRLSFRVRFTAHGEPRASIERDQKVASPPNARVSNFSTTERGRGNTCLIGVCRPSSWCFLPGR